MVIFSPFSRLLIRFNTASESINPEDSIGSESLRFLLLNSLTDILATRRISSSFIITFQYSRELPPNNDFAFQFEKSSQQCSLKSIAAASPLRNAVQSPSQQGPPV